MITYEDECVGCPTEMGCMGNSCPYMNVKRYCCDCCEEEYPPEDLRKYDNKWWCYDCFIENAKNEWYNLDEVDENDE